MMRVKMKMEGVRYCVEYTTKDRSFYDMQSTKFFEHQKDVCKFLDEFDKAKQMKNPIVYKCGFDRWSDAVIDNMRDTFNQAKKKKQKYDDDMKQQALDKLSSEEKRILGL